MRLLPAASTSFLFLIMALALCFGHAPVLGDPDTAWHLAAGDLIRAQGSIPTYDPWSFTTQGQRWYNLSWLFDASASALVNKGGLSTLYAVTLLVFAGTITCMASQCLRRGASVTAVGMVLLPVVCAVYPGVLARPNLCSVVCTLVFYRVLQRHNASAGVRGLLVLPPLMALWANLHGGFLLAFLMLAVFVAAALLERNYKHALYCAGITLACLAASLINPYGAEIYYGAYKSLAATFDQQFVMEWKPVEIGHNVQMTLLLLVFLCLGNPQESRIPLADRVLGIIMMLLALSEARHGTIAALLIMPYLSLNLTFMLHESRFGARLRRAENGIADDMRRNDNRITAAIMALCSIVFIALPYPRDTLPATQTGQSQAPFVADRFPPDQFPVLEAHYALTHFPGMRFINHYNLGGYLDYIWRGRMKTFVDGRASSLFGKDVLRDYTDFMGSGDNASAIVARYRLDGAIMPHDPTGQDSWVCPVPCIAAYRGPVATIYLFTDKERAFSHER
jgi:hypothetical protein